MKKLMSVEVKGNWKRWSFNFYGDPKYMDGWLNDGLNVMVVENIIPEWVVRWGLLRVWIVVQDIFHLKWLRKG